jgi:hypothetical protein
MQLYTQLDRHVIDSIAEGLGIETHDMRENGWRTRGKFAGRQELRFVLKPQAGSDTYRLVRESFGGKPRRCWAVDWHGHWAFMEEVFRLDPDATIKTAIATYEGLEGFYATAPATGARNIGSMMQPLAYEDATTDLLV